VYKRQEFSQFIDQKREGVKGIGYCLPEGEDSGQVRESITGLEKSNRYTLLVGPEGDFTEEEIGVALKAGYRPFHLGESRLRTETAAVYSCAAISLRYV
jgi:16S rRNA (uracil1498-N3)-methyltransferase